MGTTRPGIPYDPQQHGTPVHQHILNVRVRLDPRDRIDPDEYKVGATKQPAMHMLDKVAPILDQGQLGSCTANGWSSIYYTELLQCGLTSVQISRLMLYYGERQMEHDIPDDAGADPRDGAKFMHETGVGDEALWPYDITRFTQTPPAAVYADAPHHKIAAYYRVISLHNIKAQLLQNHCIGIAWDVFNGAETTRNGVIPMPAPGEQPLGGHWTYFNGYCDRPDWPGGGYFRMPNSWSEAWGDHGVGYMPYAYALNSQLAQAKWRIVLPKAG